MVEPVLEAEHVSKHFGGVKALSDMRIRVMPGTILGLLGENGSGKSTLIKILAGFYAPEHGAVLRINGEDVRLPIDYSRGDVPIGFVHQSLGMFLELSVLENVVVRDWARGFRWVDWAAERAQVDSALSRYGLKVNCRSKVSELAPHERATVAIVRALRDMEKAQRDRQNKARLLVLDEPSAFLSRDERWKLHEVLRRVAASGDAVLLVSHDVEEVLRVTSAVTVIRNGLYVGTESTHRLTERDLVEMIVGRAVARSLSSDRNSGAEQDSLAIARGVQAKLLRGIDFEVRRGEVLGFTGLEGSGVEELPYVLFGAGVSGAGTLSVGPTRLDLGQLSPRQAMRAGIGLVPRYREEEGGVASLPAGENLLLCVLRRFLRGGLLSPRMMKRGARSQMSSLRVVPPNPSLDFGMLSGGNQQKVLFGKWLATRPRLLVVCEPTQGVDVAARVELLRQLRESVDSGSAACVTTVDYEQLVGLCDRVLVLRQGLVAAEIPAPMSKDQLTNALLASDSPPGRGSAAEPTA